MEAVVDFAHWSAAALEALGIGVILVTAVYATAWALLGFARHAEPSQLYGSYRHRLARGILLGLEFLVAADIINTVSVELTLTSVATLAVIVAIRTFLSFTLELEMTGRWPWQGEARK